MIYQTLRPALPLAASVESIWIYSGYRPPHFFERVLPSGTIEMIVQLEGEPFRCYDPNSFQLKQVVRGPLLAGARREVQIIDTEQQLAVMGVHFRPGGFRSLFALPADEIVDMDVPVDIVLPGFGDELAERLAGATTPVGKLQAMERVLQFRTNHERVPHRVIPMALQKLEASDDLLSMGALAHDLGLSSRRFIEVFSSHVGLAPKTYARIRRFQRALKTIQRGPIQSWADLAFECGWYDQAHMIRDFKQFSGLTPAEYGRVQGEFMSHIPVEERGQICPIPDCKRTVVSVR